MRLGEFLVPSDDEWVDALGVAPVPDEGDADISCVVFESDSGDSMSLTFARYGNSIRHRWLRDGVVLVDMYREGARRILVNSGRGEARVIVEFEVEGSKSTLNLQLLPEFRIDDVQMFV